MPQVLLLHNTHTVAACPFFQYVRPWVSYNYGHESRRQSCDRNWSYKGIGRGVGRELARHGARVFVTGRSAPDRERLDERITGIRCDQRVDVQAEAAFNLIVRETSTIDILVNVWGGYERMIEDGNFTWSKPFWEQPMWRWEARRKIVWKFDILPAVKRRGFLPSPRWFYANLFAGFLPQPLYFSGGKRKRLYFCAARP
jgi:hypothetical protein